MFIIKKVLVVSLFVLCTFSVAVAEVIPNSFTADTDNTVLNELFTINIGVMRFKKNGNVNDVKPLDAENVIKSIQNTLKNIGTGQLNKKEALSKTIKYIESKNSTLKNKLSFLREKAIYSEFGKENLRENIVIKNILQKMADTDDLKVIKNKWFENFDKPVYALNILDPIDHQIATYKKICESSTTVLDLLISGEIEKTSSGYLVTIFTYSYHEDKIVYRTAFTVEKDKITEIIDKRFKVMMSAVFDIKYASLTIHTGDETEVYINHNYIGKKEVTIPYVVPGSYLATYRESYGEPSSEVVVCEKGENKELDVAPDFKKELQIVSFLIEPAGTKVFINSLYSGMTPFSTELPPGEYVVSTKTDEFHVDYRYTLKIDKVTDEEMQVAFHLMTKDVENYLKVKKYLYYTAFWNFTFSLALTIPVTIIATQYYQAPTLYGYAVNDFASNSSDEKLIGTMTQYAEDLYVFSESLRYSAIALAVNTVFAAGWLFYSLFDYLNTLEKKDFIPLLGVYAAPGESGLIIGGEIPLPLR